MSEITINQTNAVSMVEECAKCMQLEMWPQFKSLFRQLNQYYITNYKNKTEEDNFSRIWIALKSLSIDNILNKVQDCAEFDDYMNYLKQISDLIDDPEHLWEILHTEIHTIFKATPKQAKIIASTLFTPIQLFYYSLSPFLDSELCDLTNITTEDAAIDRFYALVGFVRSCGITNKDKVPEKYSQYIGKLLQIYVSLPEFSPRKFVWLVENINSHLFLKIEVLQELCSSAIETFAKKDMQVLEKIKYLGIFSTSPVMNKMPVLHKHLTDTFSQTVDFYRFFIDKYIVPGYADLKWDGKETGLPSDPVRCWAMYINNVLTSSKDCPVKRRSIEVVIDLSLKFATDYYGEIQPNLEKSHDVRRDIFFIVKNLLSWKLNLLPTTYHSIWMLLLIAAILGAEQTIIVNQPQPTPSETSILLGLEIDDKYCDFIDYKQAFSVLLGKFEAEKDSIPGMIQYLRENFK
ncbi:hypothetical protein TVAG_251270 [Trichomonas vaginalis G3]|uniref:Uncharacterized protein n=1 Tax=Trichomonas vaginalis (strain ATCC PRA-98 / G3) TaxID=412133 RepID=A2FUZ2_TRIV3|nr:hypothetical protein TVAGG3_0455750 [Trichomonas vaginalis G3]EAX91283.1 hypothetical protein TVAG_251270 [Trichomonas vaginalis G3]KAI5538451.1 hypothetical protein TVAGG3_0455750 [Trichomonas vaginalis G3]|eukprot:XP_001304213.1 hypothetical protein [Trichomonas vaginalis G3]